MKLNEVEITDFNGGLVGTIIFVDAPAQFTIVRTVTGVNLHLPVSIILKWPNLNEPKPIVTNLRATIYLSDLPGQRLELCRISAGESYEAASPENTQSVKFIWPDALRGIIYIENHRSDKPPQLEIEVRGELAYIIKCVRYFDPRDPQRPDRTLPADVHTAMRGQINKTIQVSYPIDLWEEMVKMVLELSQDDPYLLSLPLHAFLKSKSDEVTK